jgi:hypothetical protein
MINPNPLNIKINHRNWNDALAFAFHLLVTASPGDVVCITGPSRAGKSRLVKELIKLLGVQSNEFTSSFTSISVEAVNSGPNGTFSTKSFTQRLLRAVEHPSTTFLSNDFSSATRFDRITENALRDTLENAIKRRQVKYIFIDEAQHVKYVTNASQGGHAVMDSWKCLAESTGVVLIIVGAYPVLNIMDKSPHLLGRKRTVHLPRYENTENDALEFLKIAHVFLKESGVEYDLSIKTEYNFLYQGTFGCIGLLQLWFSAAVAYVLSTKSSLTLEILSHVRLTDSDLETIWQEIDTGEKMLRSLGEGMFINQTPKKTSNKKSKPFQRKPSRLEQDNRTVGSK